jgi:hypothetical protein
MVLLLVMQLTLLLAVIILSMSFSSSSKVLVAKSGCDNLQNDFALDSLLYMTQLRLERMFEAQQLPETVVKEQLQLGPTQIKYVISSESGKLNLKWLLRHKNSDQIEEAMLKLSEQLLLPEVAVNEAILPVGRDARKSIISCRTFEDFFKIEASGLRDIYGPAENNRYWLAFTTLWGSGRIDINQTNPFVLRILLQDFDRQIYDHLWELQDKGETRYPNYLREELKLSSRQWLKLKTRVRFDSEPIYTLRATAYTNKIGKSMFCVLQITRSGAKVLLRKQLPALQPPALQTT